MKESLMEKLFLTINNLAFLCSLARLEYVGGWKKPWLLE